MALLNTMGDFFAKAEIGDWCFTTSEPGQLYIAIKLTDADNGECILPIYTPPAPKPAANAWEWDGNRDAPTLSPSILHHCSPPWHGWLRAGELVIA